MWHGMFDDMFSSVSPSISLHHSLQLPLAILHAFCLNIGPDLKALLWGLEQTLGFTCVEQLARLEHGL